MNTGDVLNILALVTVFGIGALALVKITQGAVDLYGSFAEQREKEK